MRITQGTFSFLPDLDDGQVAVQIAFALAHGWAVSVEHTDDPHPRNVYWELWGLPRFDLGPDEADAVMADVEACRARHPEHYVKVVAYDAARTRQTTALSFIVQRPAMEHGFALERTDGADRTQRYGIARPRPDAVRR